MTSSPDSVDCSPEAGERAYPTAMATKKSTSKTATKVATKVPAPAAPATTTGEGEAPKRARRKGESKADRRKNGLARWPEVWMPEALVKRLERAAERLGLTKAALTVRALEALVPESAPKKK